MKVWEFEKKVGELEGITIVVRASENTEIEDYDYKKAANKTISVTELLDGRLHNVHREYTISILDGSGYQPHGNTKIEKVRNSYKSKDDI